MPSDTYTLTISDLGVTTPSAGSVTNASVASDAAIAFSKLATLTSGNVLVGSSSNVPTSVAATGDITISNTGVTSIASGAIVNADVNASAAIAHSKLAPMSSGNILIGSSGSVPTSVAVTGDVAVSSTGVVSIASGAIVNSDVNASAAIAYSKLATLTSGNILVGSSSNVPTSVAVTGDIAISSTGSTSISSGVIVNSDVNASAAIAYSKLATLTSGNILVGSSGNVPTSVVVTGDVTISNTGVTLLRTSPTLVTPILGTPTSGTLTNCTGLPLTTGVTGTLPVAKGGTGVTAASTGSGGVVLSTSPTLVTPILGTPTSGTLTSCTGLPISTGVSGLGTGVATFLATPSSANLVAAVTGDTGLGSLVFSISPNLVTPDIGVAAGTSLAVTGAITSSGTAGIGYEDGSGGLATQGSSKVNPVTINKTNGQITIDNAALASDAVATFTLVNSTIAVGDVLILNHVSGGTAGKYLLNAQCLAGSASINVTNVSSGSLSEAIVIAFVVIKADTTAISPP